jgi:hypothetical protein
MIEHAIEIEPGRRLLVAEWENDQGRRFVTVAPQYQDRAGGWRLAHSGLILSPSVACELAPALAAVAAAAVDGALVDPMPTEEDRELSRMP